ncbi:MULTISPECIES: SSI family serine proteinase inhibitor [unclassified Streptomyces]|uniref:SSI family serine proteinase inhibitor n=1 Tax=unclassified Streptomyces TaxID=2593676 RepID=UPI00224D6D47|nr:MULTISPECIES: SSI family serine proteinase inhibitor [unclassified Streptomyces]WSP53802.1 SSI family serine proteinase inhibitor [Streptomyces sp. NBC_01241]WSU25530.1 SSI family serine proteinase inhibitor [Streptomyces sp. NBC_01108]MCX4785204.1 SSI family serine proteinase inhibitor [Streptomyces sp. NBC_01221]MCX4798852.1 SSI family serine proteinase inhibitor [Streptomyces sp. NBC_01242]WSJ40055.1 SSI family serine proteinase inhibitor [Streptomyces sp. NBC_01321]
MRLSTAFAAAALFTLTAAVPAAAARSDDPVPDRGLFLTVSGSENTWIRGLALFCPPAPDAHHPEAAAACAAMDAAAGDPDNLPGDPHPCSQEYDPVAATVTGTWDGRSVSWQKTFLNVCVMDAATGPVFRF